MSDSLPIGPFQPSRPGSSLQAVKTLAVADVDADADADGLIDGVFAECDFLYTVLEESLMLDGQTAETAATVVAESKVTAREELILALTGTPE